MKKQFIISVVVMFVILSGCGMYSFSGASISPEVKTFSVQYFANRASLVQPTLSQAFTERIKDRFISQTSLRQVDRDGDIQFEGYISDYRAQPVAIQGTETAALNRLSISVLVKFTNTKDATQSFESTFTRYADYDSQKSLAEVELTLIDEVNKQLVDDVFNKSVSNW
ncbi:MAG: LptE family protein [Bacteroidetes bacterium]|nr:LptE family protein [Bacteroidota bacterium]